MEIPFHSLQHDFVDVSDMNVGSLTFEAPSEAELLNLKKELSKLSWNILEAMKKNVYRWSLSISFN